MPKRAVQVGDILKDVARCGCKADYYEVLKVRKTQVTVVLLQKQTQPVADGVVESPTTQRLGRPRVARFTRGKLKDAFPLTLVHGVVRLLLARFSGQGRRGPCLLCAELE